MMNRQNDKKRFEVKKNVPVIVLYGPKGEVIVKKRPMGFKEIR